MKAAAKKRLPRVRSRKGAPGIVDVALRAKVSPATVSRYFNSPDVVRGPTQKRIQKAAEDLGYIRDRMAGAMHNRSSGTMGLIVPTIDNAIFAEFIQAFSEELQANDRTMLIATHNYDLDLEVAIVRSLLERRIDGVALIGFDHAPQPLEMLATRNLPVLAVWNYASDSDISCVGADNREAGRRVTQYVIDQGHREIALLFPPVVGNDRAGDRLEGALDALTGAGVEPKPEYLRETAYHVGQAKEVALDLLSQHRPTVLVCGNDIIAHGAMYACQKMGLSIPGDISIIGIGDFGGSQYMQPALTTLRLPARRIGSQAARLLCHDPNLADPSYRKRVELPLQLVERDSVARLNPV